MDESGTIPVISPHDKAADDFDTLNKARFRQAIILKTLEACAHTGNGECHNRCSIVSPQNLLCHFWKSCYAFDTIGIWSNDGTPWPSYYVSDTIGTYCRTVETYCGNGSQSMSFFHNDTIRFRIMSLLFDTISPDCVKKHNRYQSYCVKSVAHIIQPIVPYLNLILLLFL